MNQLKTDDLVIKTENGDVLISVRVDKTNTWKFQRYPREVAKTLYDYLDKEFNHVGSFNIERQDITY